MKRVGWHEDETGKLCYDPMATCDKSVLTAYVPPLNERALPTPAPGTAATNGSTSLSAVDTKLALPGGFRKTNEFLAEHSSASALAAATVKETPSA